MRSPERKGGAAYCGTGDCNTVFSYEARDVFSDEVFCPECSARATDRYPTLSAARRKHPKARSYSGRS